MFENMKEREIEREREAKPGSDSIVHQDMMRI